MGRGTFEFKRPSWAMNWNFLLAFKLELEEKTISFDISELRVYGNFQRYKGKSDKKQNWYPLPAAHTLQRHNHHCHVYHINRPLAHLFVYLWSRSVAKHDDAAVRSIDSRRNPRTKKIHRHSHIHVYKIPHQRLIRWFLRYTQFKRYHINMGLRHVRWHQTSGS